MNLHIDLNKRTILSIFCVLCLMLFCFVVARKGSVLIIDKPTPLSPGNIQAMFYVQQLDSGEVLCRGDGLISDGTPISGDRQAVESVIVSAPDLSAYLGKDLEIHWTTIRRKNDEYQVVGTVGDADLINQKPDYLYSTVNELLNADVTAGITVHTEGYYNENDGGESEYLISSSPVKGSLQNIQLNNGLYAALQIKDSLNVRQLGAVGDGVADDTKPINKALNSKIPNISFSNGTYLCTQHIKVYNNNISINGNDATIITDETFNADYREWFITFSGKNIELNKLNITAKENGMRRFKTQLGVIDCTGFTMRECVLTIPKNVGTLNTEYSNLDLFSMWHNVTIDGCTFDNYSGAYYGVSAEIRDIYKAGCDNAHFTNNICHHNARDEIFAMFSSGTTKNTIKDVVITGNQFIQEPCEDFTRHVSFALGYGDTYGNGVDNVLFEGNYVRGYSTYTFFKTADSTNVQVKNNTFECHLEESKSPTLYLFRGGPDENNVMIANNNIIIVNDGINQLSSLATGNLTLMDNTIDSELKFKGTLFQKAAIDNNNTFLQLQ